MRRMTSSGRALDQTVIHGAEGGMGVLSAEIEIKTILSLPEGEAAGHSHHSRARRATIRQALVCAHRVVPDEREYQRPMDARRMK